MPAPRRHLPRRHERLVATARIRRSGAEHAVEIAPLLILHRVLLGSRLHELLAAFVVRFGSRRALGPTGGIVGARGVSLFCHLFCADLLPVGTPQGANQGKQEHDGKNRPRHEA